MKGTVKEVEIKCPKCNSDKYKLIKFKGDILIYECSCGRKFKAEFERICVSCDLIEEDFICQK